MRPSCPAAAMPAGPRAGLCQRITENEAKTRVRPIEVVEKVTTDSATRQRCGGQLVTLSFSLRRREQRPLDRRRDLHLVVQPCCVEHTAVETRRFLSTLISLRQLQEQAANVEHA